MKSHTTSFTIILMLALSCCGRLTANPDMQQIAGKCYSTSDEDSGLELKADGSFYFYGNAGGATGKYTISGDTLLLKADQEGVVFRFTRRGADLSDGGEIYRRHSVSSGGDAKVQKDLRDISTQLALYESMNDFPPTQQQGLRALVTQPTTSPVPSRWYPLFKELPKDPWGNDYVYQVTGSKFEVFSAGPDKRPRTADDIHRAHR